MDLKAVKLTKWDTCKSYVLKRIGLDHYLSMNSDKPTLEDLINHEGFEHVTMPQQGDLIFWRQEEMKVEASNEITAQGIIVTNQVQYCGHLGVFERDGMVSDLMAQDVAEQGELMTIRMRRYEDLRKADYILRAKKEV